MEIEFNPSRIPKPGSSQPIARQGATAPASNAESLSTSAALQGKLSDIPLVRPDKVTNAQALISAGDYPPDYVVDRLATLLALHLKS